ncbi:MAG: nitrophenyl compound nitroreductase subunit ArsF family protein, partial [Lachnoclostridium sp.]|nr:nitrophenyl compound nitroreductase subunit ArsF family protein [Lachnoclostridium sp.]
MKKLLMMLTLMIGLMSCGSNADNSANAATPVKDRVEVIYFHGKQRCATCMAIEKNAKEAVNAMFADELKNGSVVFKTVDISTPEGEALADKYEVSWSSLYVNKWKGGK